LIDTEKESRTRFETACIVGIREGEEELGMVHEHLDELEKLLQTLGIAAVGRSVASIKKPSSVYYVGSGKAEEIARYAQEIEADCLVFDTPLSSSQQRNWEHLVKAPAIDREEIILDIFAERAATAEARLQVELAQLHYYLPRLTRAWSHLSRQRGGTHGLRGQGESQIETDRRLVKRRISQLEKELELVRKQRSTARKSRSRTGAVCAALVGYTNVGKSSLLRALSGAGVLVEDKLFATLDPTTRKIQLPDKQELLLTDTVGFIRRLPHTLVEAFKSTLEEAVLADFLVLVLDLASPVLEEQYETTIRVLKELGADEKDLLIVFNKLDLFSSEERMIRMARLRALFPDSIFCSTQTGENMDVLVQKLQLFSASRRAVRCAVLPPDRSDLAALAHAHGNILEETYAEDGTLRLRLSIEEKYIPRFEPYWV